MEQSPALHMVILSSPGMGHLIPLVQLAEKLLQINTNLAITFIISGDIVSSHESLIGTLPRVKLVPLTAEVGGDIPESETLELKILSGLIRRIPAITSVLKELSGTHRELVFLLDSFNSFCLDAAKELGIPAYVFFASAAFALSTGFYLREHYLSHDFDFRDVPGPVKIPGFTPIDSHELPNGIQDRSTKTYQMLLQMINKYLLGDGILVNSFVELEPDAFDALQNDRYIDIPPVYAVGPLIQHDSTNLSDRKSLEWLDLQPANSVLYVSFGSGGTLSSHQLTELTIGLEASLHRFLFVVRKPSDVDKSAAYFHSENREREFDFLPNGFIERTKDRGFVLMDWAPQIEILRHPAIGGFLTHCGWNSILESIVHGVPFIAWPLFAEQKMNAIMLSEILLVGLRVKENENGVVDSQQIKSLVKRLMEEDEGHLMRDRVKELRNESNNAIGEDGTSTKALRFLCQKWNVISK